MPTICSSRAFLAANQERNRFLNCIWIDSRAEVGALSVIQSVDHAFDVAHINKSDLRALSLQLCTACDLPDVPLRELGSPT